MDNIYKNELSSYKDWEKYNHSSGHGQWGRFLSAELICKNPNCKRFNDLISEKEAFYHFAKLGIFQRMKLIMLTSGEKSLYVCPFCGERKRLSPANGRYSVIS